MSRQYNFFNWLLFSNLKVVVDVLIRDVDPVFHENNTTNSTRYVWSSLEKVLYILLRFNLILILIFSIYFGIYRWY